MKKTITITVEEIAATAAKNGVRLDALKAAGAVAGGLVTINDTDYDWKEFIDSYWKAVNAAKTTRTSYSLK